MQLKIFDSHEMLSDYVSDEILRLVTERPQAVLCLPSGHTPARTCELLVRKALEHRTDFSRCMFIGLDEWLGIPPENEGSCFYFFRTQLFRHLNFSPDRMHLFDGLAADPQAECRKMDAVIAGAGGIDLMVVGVGMNGHIGFNEPGTRFDHYAHVAQLDETTRNVGQKYFTGPMVLKQGITLGLQHLQEARAVMMMANGPHKAGIIREVIEGAISNQVPATIIRTHPAGQVLVDRAAAARIAP